MGQEIFYCSGCHNQLRSADFEKGKAYKLGLEAVCAKCAPEAMKSLPTEKLQALQNAMSTTPKSGTGRVPVVTSTPRSGTGRVPVVTSTPRSGTGRVPLAAPPTSTRRIPVAPGESSNRPLIFGVVIAAVVLAGAVFALSGRSAPEPGTARTTPPAPLETPLPPPSETTRDRQAREALRKAHVYADVHPQEFLEQFRLFELAAAESKGTAFDSEVHRAFEKAKRRVQDAGAAELKTIDDQIRDACAKEDFKRAEGLLEAARRKPVTPDWPGELDRRSQEIQAKIDSAFGRLRTQALIAKPGSPELAALRDRLSKWGQERLSADLDKALADAAVPKPAPTPAPLPVPAPAPAPAPPDAPKLPPAAEAEAFGKSWSASLLLACGRDFSLAIQELERVSPTLQNPALKSQAAADLDVLKAVAALHAEAGQALAKWPAGKKIAFTAVDFDNNPQKSEGTMVRVRNGTIEINKGKSPAQLPLGHLTARSLAEFAPGRNRASAAIACLIEGDAQGAKELAGENNPAIPARYWTWAADVSKPADKETEDKERGARYGYYFAVLNQGAPALRAEAALKCRKILEEHASMTWVRRNRAMLAAVADTTREYVAGPATLRPAGMFRLEVPKTLPYWMSSIDVDPAKRRDNYVEMEFSVLNDATYRAWAWVGACCSEALVFYAQTTDLAGAEPGSEPETPVKHALSSATKNHSGHPGRKGPTKWGWVELPLPKYEKPGAKVLRLVTASQGFSVGWMVVSSLRDKPPADGEAREWERDIVHSPGPAGPTIGLAAWFKADAAVAVDGGRVAQWQDQSGHGRHAVQVNPAARPTLLPAAINSRPALRFDGAASVLSFDCPVNGSTALTLIMVAAPTQNQRNNELGNYAALEWAEFGPWGNVFLSPQETCVAWRFGTAQFGNVCMWERPGGTKAASVTMVRKDGSKEELFVQGTLVHAPKDKTPTIAHTIDLATIGAGNDARQNPLRHYSGDIAEILIFTRAISEAERDAIERYLRSKYGI